MPKDGTKVQDVTPALGASQGVPARVESDAAPVLVVVFGRGGNGKSTGAAEIAWRLLHHERRVIVADGDFHRSRTLSELFPDVSTHPPSTEPNDVKAWLTETLNRMVRERASVVLDCGTENRPLQEFCRDLRLVEFCKRRGFRAVALYFLGPEPEDLRHVLSIWEGKYFRPDGSLLMLNEGAVRAGKTVEGAFDATVGDPGVEAMLAGGVKMAFVRFLGCMGQVRKPGFGFYAAAFGGVLDPVEEFQCQDWIADLEAERERVGAGAWF